MSERLLRTTTWSYNCSSLFILGVHSEVMNIFGKHSSLLRIGLFVAGLITTPYGIFAQCAWDPVIQDLAARPDAASKRASANLTNICTDVTAQSIHDSAAAKKCLGAKTRIFTETDTNLLKTSFGKIGSQALKALIPAVATLLGGPVASAISVFLTPQQLGNDAIDVISNPARYSKDDLNKAARQLIRDTDPPAFKSGLSLDRRAGVAACILAQ